MASDNERIYDKLEALVKGQERTNTWAESIDTHLRTLNGKVASQDSGSSHRNRREGARGHEGGGGEGDHKGRREVRTLACPGAEISDRCHHRVDLGTRTADSEGAEDGQRLSILFRPIGRGLCPLLTGRDKAWRLQPHLGFLVPTK